MPRLKLNDLDHYQHVSKIKVRVGDLNYGAHLGNDRLLSIIHQTRVELLAQFGVSEMDLGDQKTGLIMCDLQVVYKGEAFLNDKLTIYSDFNTIKRSSFRMSHLVKRDDQQIAILDIGFAAFNYNDRKTAAIPDSLLSKIKEK